MYISNVHRLYHTLYASLMGFGMLFLIGVPAIPAAALAKVGLVTLFLTIFFSCWCTFYPLKEILLPCFGRGKISFFLRLLVAIPLAGLIVLCIVTLLIAAIILFEPSSNAETAPETFSIVNFFQFYLLSLAFWIIGAWKTQLVASVLYVLPFALWLRIAEKQSSNPNA